MYSQPLDDDSKLHLLGYTVNSRSKYSHAKRKWNRKNRTSLSFFMVIAFFAVFILIILVEIFVIDGKGITYGDSGSAGGLRHIGYNHIDESVSDFDDVNDEYSIESAVFGRNRFRAKHRGELNIAVVRNAHATTVKFNEDFPIADPNAEPKDPNGLPKNLAWGSVLPMEIERTLPPYASDTKPMDGTWQTVNGTRFKFFVYSAFYDRRGGKLIRIIGATKTHRAEKVWCRFVYNQGNSTTPSYRAVSVMARVKVTLHPVITNERHSLIHF